MRTEELDYYLPEDLIAQEPVDPRDSSRLLVCNKSTGELVPRFFRDLPDLLKPGDLLVTNQARVMPARLVGYKFPSGARIEILLLEKIPDKASVDKVRFKALLNRRRRLDVGDTILFPESTMSARIVEADEELGEDIIEVGFNDGTRAIESEIDRIGSVPLPPYIKSYSGDSERYQTIFAKVTGSVAAPTASLHFTDDVLKRLEERGIGRVECHLRVGWGTFSPIRSDNLEDHSLHEELGEISEDVCRKINETRKNGGQIVAVGTTVTRLLETASDENGLLHEFAGPTSLFITPGYRFKAVDVLITNFHLPKTSLLALVAAFMGTDMALEAYNFAIENKFRFYSFGDAMLIL
jgi:S-adenosylmethionine:tRNA ribosyltransferase-isomerase